MAQKLKQESNNGEKNNSKKKKLAKPQSRGNTKASGRGNEANGLQKFATHLRERGSGLGTSNSFEEASRGALVMMVDKLQEHPTTCTRERERERERERMI